MIKYTNLCIPLYLPSPLLFKYTHISIAKNFLGQIFFWSGRFQICQLKGHGIQYVLLTVVSISMLNYEATNSCLYDYEINSMNAAEE